MSRLRNYFWKTVVHTNFEEEGIGTHGVLSDDDAPSGVALITVDERRENSIVVASVANARLSPDDVTKSFGEVGDATERGAHTLLSRPAMVQSFNLMF